MITPGSRLLSQSSNTKCKIDCDYSFLRHTPEYRSPAYLIGTDVKMRVRWSRKHEDIWGWHDGGLIHHITCKLGIEINQIKIYVNIAP
jgi:hypothetical protein